MAKDNITALYGALKDSYELGSEDDFRKYLSDGNNREALRKELENDYEVGDSAAFSKYLGFEDKPQPTESPFPKDPMGLQQMQKDNLRDRSMFEDARYKAEKNKPQVQQPEVKPAAVQQPKPAQQSKGGLTWQEQMAMSMGTQQMVGQVKAGNERIDSTINNTKNMSPVGNGLTHVGMNKNLRTEKKFNAEKGQFEDVYKTTSGQTFSADRAFDADQQQKYEDYQNERGRYIETMEGLGLGDMLEEGNKDVEARLEDAYAEKERLQKLIKEGRYGQMGRMARAALPAGTSSFSKDDIDNAKEYDNLLAAMRMLDRRITALQAERDDAGFLQGTGDVLTDPSTYSMGLTDASDALAMANIKKKIDAAKGGKPNFTEGEKMLVRNYLMNQDAQQLNENRGWLYNFGQGFGQTLSFMADFALTGGGFGNLAKGGLKMGAKMGAKALATDVAQYMAKNLGTKSAKILEKSVMFGSKTAGMALGAEVGGAALAGTIQAPKTLANIAERHMGNLTVSKDGTFEFKGGESEAKAAILGFLDASGENASELVGPGIDAVAGKIAKYAVGKYGTKIAESAAGKFVKGFTDNKVWKSGEKTLGFLGVNSVFGEGMEEEYGMMRTSILNAITNNEFNPNAEDITSLNNQLNTWATVGLTSVILRTPQMIASGKKQATYYGYKYNLNTTDKMMRNTFNDDVRYQSVKDMLDNTENKDFGNALHNIVSNAELTPEEKKAVVMYANDLIALRGFNIGDAVAAANGIHDTPRTDRYNISGNTIEEVDKEGNVLATHEYDSREEMKSALWEMQTKRANDDLQSDISVMKARPNNQFEILVDEYAAEAGVNPEEVENVLNKNPMDRTAVDQQLLAPFAKKLHEAVYDSSMLHEEQSTEDGQDIADTIELEPENMAPEQTQDVADVRARWEGARMAREQLFERNEDIAQEVSRLEAQGLSPQEVVSSLSSFREEEVQVVIDYYNQKARFEGMMNRLNDRIDEEARNRRDRNTFKGTINGNPDQQNIYTITDGENTYTLVSGNITMDADGNITGSDSGMLIGVDANGDFVTIGDSNGYTIANGGSLDEYAEAQRAILQEGISSVVDPDDSMQAAPTPEGETAETVVPGPETTEEVAANAGGEAGVEGSTGANEPSAPATIPVDDNGLKRYEQGVSVDDAIADLGNDGFDVNEMADAYIAEAQEQIDKINNKRTKLPKDIVERKRLQEVVDYYNQLKARNLELNPPYVDPQPYLDELKNAQSKTKADEILNRAITAGVKAEEVQPAHTQKVQDILAKQEEARRRAEEVTDKDMQDIAEKSGTPEGRAWLLDKKRVTNAEKRRKMAKLIYKELFDDDFEAYRDINELISMWLSKGRTLDPDTFGQELGWDMGIGKDAAKVSTMFAARRENGGDGILFNDFVHMVAEASEGRYDTQEVRNALIGMFQGAQEKSDLTEYQLTNRVAEAERLLVEAEIRDKEAAEEAKTGEDQPISEGLLPFPPATDEVPFGNAEATEQQEETETPEEPAAEEVEETPEQPKNNWQYNLHYDKETGHVRIDRDDVSGPIPIGDGRWHLEAKSLEEMRGILENPANNLGEVYEQVEARLHNEEVGEQLRKESNPMNAIEQTAEQFNNEQNEEKDTYGAENKLVSQDRYEQLKKRMRSKLLGQLNAGFDPEIMEIGAEMAMFHIEAGARKFSDYASRMIADLGDAIRPYLQGFYEAARRMPGMEELRKEMDSTEVVDNFDVQNFDKTEGNSVNVNKTENNEAENVVSSQEEEAGNGNNAVEMQGDSAEYAEQEKNRSDFGLAVFDALRTAVFQGDIKLKTMQGVKALAKEYNLDHLSMTDLQELVEAQIVNLARKISENEEWTDEQKFEYIKHLYEWQPTLSARDNDRINKQQYSTPAPMAWLMGKFVDPKHEAESGLEPSAGNGMLTIALPKGIMHVNDIDEMRLSNLAQQGFKEVTNQDGTQPFEPKAYDVVVTNPPFGNVAPKMYDGYETTGLEHQMAINALDSMKDDGRAAIIIGGNTEYKDNGSIKGKDRAFLNYLYSHYNVVDVINIDGKAMYAKQGTGYNVRMILINGRKQADGTFAPVQSKARAEQVKSYEELYNRVNDDILSDSNRSASVHDTESGESGRVDDNSNAGESTEKRVRSVRTEGGSEQHSVLPADRQRVSGSTNTTDTRTERSGREVVGEPVSDDRSGTESAKPSESASVSEEDGNRTESGRDNAERLPAEPSNSERVGQRGTEPTQPTEQPERKRSLGTEKVPYNKQSQNPFTLQSLMPAEQADVVKKALEELGDTDQFLVDELGYSSKEELYKALAAEQIDSVAMAIHQMNQGNAFIIGDQTGIGKGRQAAALIRYGVKKGGFPVFITVKKGLFSDMYRDLCDIGSPKLKPFIWSADDTQHSGNVTDKDGNVIYELPTAKEQKRVLEYINKYGKLPKEYDYVLTTYDSFKSGTMDYENGEKKARNFGKKKPGPMHFNGQAKRDALERLAESSYVIMDESHNAGGEKSNISGYLQYITTKAKGLTFLSATFAKRPGNMPIYSLKTAISKAGVKIDELIDSVKRGGATFQEIMSKALTEAGQMIRRERDMTGVTIDWRGIEDEAVIAKQREQYDQIIGLFNDIIDFQRTYVDPIVDSLNDDAAESQGEVEHTPGTRDMGINNTPFASRTYNIVQQVLLSLKAEEAAKRAIEHLKMGHKPVITVANTNEGAADEVAGVGGEAMEMPDLSINLRKGLEGTMRISSTDANGNTTKSEIPFDKLSEEGQNRYREIMDAISNASTGLSLSPIDVIKNELKKAGYKVGELTGRKSEFVYNEDGTVNRVNRQDTDKKMVAADFNSGKIDALILNRSAGTGISLHASTKFEDQRQRVMIVAQAQGDVNDEVQIRGRIDRTGQVLRGMYEYVVSQIPSEQRLLMMLKAKLRSLDANTTSSQKSKFNEMDVQDIINKYGDQICVQYLAEHTDLASKMADPLKWGDSMFSMSPEALVESANKKQGAGETASMILGRMALLKVTEQEQMLDDLGALYTAEITRLNEMGENDLEITEMPLNAKTLNKQVWEQGVEPGGKNPFADNTYVEKVEMDVLVKPMKGSEVKASQERLLGGKTWDEYKQGVLADVEKWAENKKAEVTETYTARATKKATAERDKYVKGATKAKEKNGMSDADIEKNGQYQYDHFYKEEMDKLKGNLADIDKQKQVFVDALETFTTDGVYVLPEDIYDLGGMSFDTRFGKLIDVKIASNCSTAASTLSFATLDGRRKITIPISGMVTQKNGKKQDIKPWIVQHNAQVKSGMMGSNPANTLKVLEQNLDNWDRLTSTATRKEGYIITGNLLKALVETKKQGKGGKLISYTTDTGEVRQGILMSDQFEPSGLTAKTPISSVTQILKGGDQVVSADGDVVIVKTDGIDWLHTKPGKHTEWLYQLGVPKSKKRGEKYFNDETLLGLMDDQFEGTSRMRALFPERNLDAVLKRLDELGVVVAEEHKDESERRYDMDETKGIEVTADEYAKISHSDAQAKGTETRQGRIAKHIDALVEKLGTKTRTTVYHNFDELPEKDKNFIREAEKKGKKVRGWYENGHIYLYLPHINSEYQAEKTIWHETVGHHGLRALVGEENVNKLLKQLWLQHHDGEMGKWVSERMATNGWNLNEAIEEYLAREAEKNPFKEPGLWQRLRWMVAELFHKMGFASDPTITDIQYLFWVSKNQLREGDPMAAIRKQSFLHNLDKEAANTPYVNMFAGNVDDIDNPDAEGAYDEGTRYSEETDEEVIERLEKEPKVKVYRAMSLVDGKLYPPMATKQDGKLVNPIELGKWERSDEHPEKAVLKNGKWVFKLTKDNGKSLFAAYNPYIHTSTTMLNDQFSEAQNRDNLVVVECEVPESELTSGYKADKAKDAVGKLEWKAGIIQGQLSGTREVILSRWDKPVRIVPTEEVAQHIADMIKDKVEVMPTNVVTPQQRAELEKLGVKFVETDNRGFINEGENNGKSYSSVYGKKRGRRYDMDIDNPMGASAKALYEDRLNRVETVFTEAYQDSMVSLKTAQNAIAKDKEIPDSQNAYQAENLMHGKNKNEQDLFNQMFRDPLINAINAILNKTGWNWGDVDRYVYAKSALERNREFFVRDHTTKEKVLNDWYQLKQDLYEDLQDGRIGYYEYLMEQDFFIKTNIDSDYDPSENDYSGLRAMYGDEKGNFKDFDVVTDVETAEAVLGDDVAADLWEKINAATTYGLERYREAGMRSDEQIDKVERMFNFYVPMRGFKKDTGEDMYQYFTEKGNRKSYVGGLLKHAKGRGSEANYPISTIFAMGYKAIADCNQNLVCQKLYRLCQANPNDLIVLSDSWAKLNPVTQEWEEAYPDIDDDMDEEDIRQTVKAFEEQMKIEEAAGNAKKIRGKASFSYKPTDKKKKSEHVVDVRINGDYKRMIVTGNPRMAQALNGQLRFEHGKNVFSNWNAKIKNLMASLFTSYSPTFAMRNLFRDWTHFRMMLGVREGHDYAATANKYYRKSLFKMVGLFKKYREGTLDMNNEMERDFKDFMDNGGVTGFVMMQKVDDIQKDMEKLYKQQKEGKVVKLNNALWDNTIGLIEAVNEGIENNARFATFRASRHFAGRTKARSAYDAKEITVNFNRKGAGSKTNGYKSDSKMVEDAAAIFGVTSQVLGEGRIFFNATVQAIATTFKNFQNPDGSLNYGYISKWTAKYALTPFMFGLLLPYINQILAAALDGDDNDDVPYANLAEWTRRKNICIYIGNNNFITIPIGQELAAFLTLGDITAGLTYAPDVRPVDRDIKDEMIGVMNTFSPIDVDTKITKGGFMEDPISETVGRTFSVVAPLVAIEQNIGWTGRPIYREDKYQNDEYTPEYQMVYKSTNPLLVDALKMVHEMGGGDDIRRGKGEVNPGIVQYLWEQYTGGPGKFLANTVSIGKDIKDVIMGNDNNFNIRKVEGVKAFVQQGDDRTDHYRAQAKYRKYLEDARELKYAVDGYKKDKGVNPEHALKYDEIRKGKDYVRMSIILEADEQLSKLYKEANKAEGTKRKELYKKYNELVAKVVKKLDKVGDE